MSSSTRKVSVEGNFAERTSAFSLNRVAHSSKTVRAFMSSHGLTSLPHAIVSTVDHAGAQPSAGGQILPRDPDSDQGLGRVLEDETVGCARQPTLAQCGLGFLASCLQKRHRRNDVNVRNAQPPPMVQHADWDVAIALRDW